MGDQLVYVKELALAMGELGHEMDVVTRRTIGSDWPTCVVKFAPEVARLELGVESHVERMIVRREIDGRVDAAVEQKA